MIRLPLCPIRINRTALSSSPGACLSGFAGRASSSGAATFGPGLPVGGAGSVFSDMQPRASFPPESTIPGGRSGLRHVPPNLPVGLRGRAVPVPVFLVDA